ncbi:MAG: hypothetical protein GY856_53410 [bacterium]|nr:hypothetical protein [bacterium]
MKKAQTTRREFVVGGARGAFGLVAGAALAACGGVRTAVDFPSFEVSGSPREIGRGIGQRFGGEIRRGLERRAEWFAELKGFAKGAGQTAYDQCVEAAGKHTPRVVAELEGWAEGSGIPFADLMVLNLKAELGAMMKERDEMPGEAPPGCSTVVLATPERVLHVHNEDGSDAYQDLMFVLRVRPEGGVGFLTLCYPGILPGNAPGINARGVAQTTNYIASREVRPGLGRYFIDRMALEAGSIDEALSWASHPERAYAFHHVFTSVPEKRSVGIEVTPTKKQVQPVEGLYLHTNHLILDGMADEPQDEEYVSSSSRSRWDVIRPWAERVKDSSALDRAQLLEPLSSHDGAPYSPCRHPRGEVRGLTLGTAVFEAPSGRVRFSYGPPCQDRWREYALPWS